tara:strand:- start:1472 stop:1957 length:486 start_codon:yes stop_codon:yes gene_type:complete
MKDNYRKALHKAQESIVPKRRKFQGVNESEVTDAIIEDTVTYTPDGNAGNTTNIQTIRPGQGITPTNNMDWNVGATTPHQTIINEDFNISDLYKEKTIPMVGASNVPTSGGRGSWNVNSGVFPTSNEGTMHRGQIARNGTEIGKDSYMAALKAYKKGGSKR